MREVQKRDWQVFWQTLLKPSSILRGFIFALCGYFLSTQGAMLPLVFGTGFVAVGAWAFTAYLESTQRRFHNIRLKNLYTEVADRSARMQKAIRLSRESGSGVFSELPQAVRRVDRNIYYALRRADILADEVIRSEGGTSMSRPSMSHAKDPQAQALLQMADRNVVEYNQALAGVWAAVERTEAQAMVFVTTLDGLRVRMLGHRLAARTVDIDNMDFLSTIAETKMQLSAIDQALEEIEMQPFPKMIAVMPPTPPTDEHQQQGH